MVVVERAEAVAGAGLRGDRYLTRDGSFDGPIGHDLTLVEAERSRACSRRPTRAATW